MCAASLNEGMTMDRSRAIRGSHHSSVPRRMFANADLNTSLQLYLLSRDCCLYRDSSWPTGFGKLWMSLMW